MTDKEIAQWLGKSRFAAYAAREEGISSSTAFHRAELSVSIIHHIINSINWED